MSAALINTKMSEAVVALEAGDLVTAEVKAVAVQGYITARPNTKAGDSELQWERESIDKFISNIRRMQTAAVGIRRSKVSYDPVTG